MLKTMKYLKSIRSSMTRRPRKVHAETKEESFVPVAVTCAWAAEGDEDVSEPSFLESTFLASDSNSNDDCESLSSHDTVYGRRYRTVRVYGIVDPGFIPEGLASPQSSATDRRTSTVLDVMAPGPAPSARWVRMSLHSDSFSVSSLSTRYAEESVETSDDEDWEHNSHVSDETR
eukprot:TRINITY_DN13575_c0_g1_i1.p1 TRINITY_DN13575_c0_g1~~TRINITY_DN13575_c0_g1_i1.p1  ORF type:complete len:174 (-),score=17.82 TRINITY_DN13575_c0_g1_i1:130-651(-)